MIFFLLLGFVLLLISHVSITFHSFFACIGCHNFRFSFSPRLDFSHGLEQIAISWMAPRTVFLWAVASLSILFILIFALYVLFLIFVIFLIVSFRSGLFLTSKCSSISLCVLFISCLVPFSVIFRFALLNCPYLVLCSLNSCFLSYSTFSSFVPIFQLAGSSCIFYDPSPLKKLLLITFVDSLCTLIQLSFH